jgi:hypothetical protein
LGFGELPQIGVLDDPDFKGLSAKAIYNQIVRNLRYYRKLATLRGIGQCDISESGEHAYLIPIGRQLPFNPKGEVFTLK